MLDQVTLCLALRVGHVPCSRYHGVVKVSPPSPRSRHKVAAPVIVYQLVLHVWIAGAHQIME